VQASKSSATLAELKQLLDQSTAFPPPAPSSILGGKPVQTSTPWPLVNRWLAAKPLLVQGDEMANQALKTNSGVILGDGGIIYLDDTKYRSCNRFLQDLKASQGISLEIWNKQSSFWLRQVGWFFLKTKLNPRFMSHFFTIIGNRIYAPIEIIEAMTDVQLLQILMHETIHAFDRKKYGTVLFSVAYLFPQILAILAPVGAALAAITGNLLWLWLLTSLLFLAPIPAPFRTWFEIRANRSDISFVKKVVYNNRTGDEIPGNYIELLSNHYINGEYYYMWPFRGHVIKLLKVKPDVSDKAYLFVAKWAIIHKAATGLDVSVSFYKQ
jgi:hypothetical protein